MSKLGQLTIVGSLTPCSKLVKVQNQIINATVVLTVKPKTGAAFTAGGGTATWPDQDFPIPSLKTGDILTAIQTASGFTASDPVSTTVGASPTSTELSKGNFAAPIYVCSKCIYLYNLFPGAVVAIESNGQPLGKDIVRNTGEAFVGLNRELLGSDNLRAVLSCGATVGSPISGGSPVRPPSPLPAPTVEPAIECDRAIQVSGIVPGAQVTVSRGAQKMGPFCVPTGRLIISPIKGLKKPTDDLLTAVQALPHDLCRLTSPTGSTTLQKAGQIKPPLVVEPLCEGQTDLSINAMRLGAMVELTANGTTLVFGAGTTSLSVKVSPLTFPQTVTVRQNTCGDPASWSALRKAVVNSSKPLSPKQTAPANGAANVSVTPMLTWLDIGAYCSRAQSFDVQIATNAAFTSQLQQTTLPGATNVWFPPTKLKFSTVYQWRVRSNHAGQAASAWSTSKFTTAAEGKKPGSNPPPPGSQDFCFVEDCCPFFRRKIVVNAPTQADAMAKAIAQSPGCSITPCDCNARVPGCSQP